MMNILDKRASFADVTLLALSLCYGVAHIVGNTSDSFASSIKISVVVNPFLLNEILYKGLVGTKELLYTCCRERKFQGVIRFE